ncbi:MAG TPA: HAD family hydrolase [Thermoplasmata archaeon]|nr:HAD family hydrolase [Thermoplasmata archaeon]
MTEVDGSLPQAVLFALDDVLLPRQTSARWQWAWRPQGPLLPDRHLRPAIKRAVQTWDRTRWEGLGAEAGSPAGIDYRELLRGVLGSIAGHPLPATEVEAVVDRFPRFPDEAGPFPDVVPFLQWLGQHKVRFGVLADRPGEQLTEAIRRAGILPLLPNVFGGGASDPKPPLPESFRAACRGLEARPAETLYVAGLFWSEYRSARRAGLDAVLMDRSGWWERVQAPRIRSLSELLTRFSPPVSPRPVLEGSAPA